MFVCTYRYVYLCVFVVCMYTSEFLDAGGYKWNERAGNWRLGMGRQRGVEKENTFTLGTGRCEISRICIKIKLLLLSSSLSSVSLLKHLHRFHNLRLIQVR